MSEPQLRIVIPAYKASKTISHCLSAIQQSATNQSFEVVVVDDGENGDLQSLQFDFPLSIAKAGKQNTGYTRNVGASSFKGDIILFIDADVQMDKNTIDLLTDPIRSGIADASMGNYSRDVDNLNFVEKYKQLYLSRIYSRRSGFVKNFFWTAIGAIKTDLFKELGGFDCNLDGNVSEDVEFGQRLTKHNARIKLIPDATGIHLKHHTFSSLVRNDFRKGISSFYLSLCNANSVTNNPHATLMDAVAAVYSFFLIFCIGVVMLLDISAAVSLISILSLFLVYLLLRTEFLSVYANQGVFFLLKTIPLMYFLDLLRIVSVIAGTIKYIRKIFRDKFKFGLFSKNHEIH